jgi:CHAT domain-containing protein/tetratricopeptide (TPR) repeat protein
MGALRMSGWVIRIALAGLLPIALSLAAHAQGKSLPGTEITRRPNPQESGSEADQLNSTARKLYLQGKYKEALEVAQQSLAAAQRQHGPDHYLVGSALNNLGVLYVDLGRLAEGEDYHNRALAIREKARGPNHPEYAQSLNNLAILYKTKGRYAEAEQMHKRALAIREKVRGPEHPDVAQSLSNLAEVYHALDRLGDAEPLYKRALAIREKVRGPDHPDVASSLRSIAILYVGLARYSDAEPLLRRCIAIREKALGPDHIALGNALVNLGDLYRIQGRLGEAEALFKRGLAIHEKTFGPEHASVSDDLEQLGVLYRNHGRHADAEPLFKRSLMIREKHFGANSRAVANSADNLATVYRVQRRFAEAEEYYKRAIAIKEQVLGTNHRSLGYSIIDLAELYRLNGRHADAQTLYERGLRILQQSLPPDHPDIGFALTRLALLHRTRGQPAEAEPLLRRALEIRERALGANHPSVAQDVSNLAHLAFSRSDWAQAALLWRRSTGILRRRALADTSGEAEGENAEVQRAHSQFRSLVKAVYRAGEDRRGDGAAAREMFEIAQWAEGSEAAASIAQMAARGASNDPGLSALVRERQDLAGEWQLKDKQLIAAKSMTPDKRKPDAEAAIAHRLAAIDKRMTEISGLFVTDYPDYVALASTRPVSVGDVQANLRDDEALVLFFDTPAIQPLQEETFIWVVTKTAVRWAPAKLGKQALSREVAALRCGLDATAWNGKGAERCAALIGLNRDRVPTAGQPLPFDTSRAHRLYVALFGGVQDLIRDKHLLIVASGPLAQLPFPALVTRPPGTGDLRTVPWLAREHATTILPAPSSLKALRRIARRSSAPLPMIGFGNPLLEGPDGRYAELAKRARDTQRCPDRRLQRGDSGQIALQRGVETVATSGGFADLERLKHQTPLPETADELCAVARDVKADTREMRLGARATEREVKTLSTRGDLMRYRIVHFATHGTLANQLMGVAEPGLILTPPGQASDNDDGYLSASEIAGLRLDADWVILSACNTAAGSGGRSEALSGLAQAFIYAGARALLVSHWAVDSDAAVKLVTAAVREMARDPRVGRGEALRRAALALVDSGAGHEVHPAYWAPFVVVGEGAAQ